MGGVAIKIPNDAEDLELLLQLARERGLSRTEALTELGITPPPIARPADQFPLPVANVGAPPGAVPLPVANVEAPPGAVPLASVNQATAAAGGLQPLPAALPTDDFAEFGSFANTPADARVAGEFDAPPTIAAAAVGSFNPLTLPATNQGIAPPSSGTPSQESNVFSSILDGFFKVAGTGIFGDVSRGLAGSTSIGRGLAAATGFTAKRQQAAAELAVKQQRADQAAANAAARLNLAERKLAFDQTKPGAQKTPIGILLPNNQNVLSFDRRTYLDPVTNERKLIPSNATLLGPESGAKLVQELKVRAAAQADLNAATVKADSQPIAAPTADPRAARNAADSALAGTGIAAAFKAATNAAIGGVFNTEFFPDTQESRKHLAVIKQMGLIAFSNSTRGAVWALKAAGELFPDADTWFTNPITEARKVPLMISTLNDLKRLNNEAIVRPGLSTKQREERVSNNLDINRTLLLLGAGQGGRAPAAGETTTGVTPSGVQFTVN